MSEILEIIKDVSLVLAGTLSGAALTYYVSIKLEKRERDRRRSEAIQLLSSNVRTQLTTIDEINSEIDKIANAGQEEEVRNVHFNVILSYPDVFRDNVYSSVMRDLALLPGRCYDAVSYYYTFAEKLYREALRRIQTKDLNLLKPATTLLSGITKFGIDALSNLISVDQGITVKEAEEVVRLALMAANKIMKEVSDGSLAAKKAGVRRSKK